MKAKVKAITKKFYPLISIALFLVLWYIAAKSIGVEMVLPTPKVALQNLFQLLGEGKFWGAVGGTLYRTLISFVMSFIAALVLAILSYLFDVIYKLLSPIVVIVRSTPTMSIILLAVIWLTSDSSPVLIGMLIVFPLLYANFYGGLKGIDEGLINMSKLYNIPLKNRIFELFIPGILPSMFVAVKSSISLNVKVVIAAEVIAQTKGSMGNLMQISRIYLDTGGLLAWTIMAVVISYLLEFLVVAIRKIVIRWD